MSTGVRTDHLYIAIAYWPTHQRIRVLAVSFTRISEATLKQTFVDLVV
jgi:hypothetical protein